MCDDKNGPQQKVNMKPYLRETESVSEQAGRAADALRTSQTNTASIPLSSPPLNTKQSQVEVKQHLF